MYASYCRSRLVAFMPRDARSSSEACNTHTGVHAVWSAKATGTASQAGSHLLCIARVLTQGRIHAALSKQALFDPPRKLGAQRVVVRVQLPHQAHIVRPGRPITACWPHERCWQHRVRPERQQRSGAAAKQIGVVAVGLCL